MLGVSTGRRNEHIVHIPHVILHNHKCSWWHKFQTSTFTTLLFLRGVNSPLTYGTSMNEWPTKCYVINSQLSFTNSSLWLPLWSLPISYVIFDFSCCLQNFLPLLSFSASLLTMCPKYDNQEYRWLGLDLQWHVLIESFLLPLSLLSHVSVFFWLLGCSLYLD